MNDGGVSNEITITNVIYIKDLPCNKISTNTDINSGFDVIGTKSGYTLYDDDIKLNAYIKYKGESNHLFGFNVTVLTKSNYIVLTIQQIHEKLRHPKIYSTLSTIKNNNIET